MIEAELHDGTILEFPDGTAPDIIQRTVKSQLGITDKPSMMSRVSDAVNGGVGSLIDTTSIADIASQSKPDNLAAVRAGIKFDQNGLSTVSDRAMDIAVDRAIAPSGGEERDTMAETSRFLKGSTSPRIADQEAVTRKPEVVLADAIESSGRYVEAERARAEQERNAAENNHRASLRVLAASDTPGGMNARRILNEEGHRSITLAENRRNIQQSATANAVGSLARGTDNLQAIGYALGSMGADVAGVEGWRDGLMKEVQRNLREAEENPAAVGTFKNIDSFGDAGQYAVEAIFENLPMFLPSMVTGGVGSTLARKGAEKLVADMIKVQVGKGIARDVAENQAARLIAKRIELGAIAGAYPAAAGMEVGSIYSDIYEKTGEYKPGVASVYGAVAGAFDTIPQVMALKKMFGAEVVNKVTQSLARKYGTAAIKQFGAEGITEGIQTAIERLAVERVDGNQRAFTQQGIDEIIDATLKGGIGGSVTGVGAQAIGDAFGGAQIELPQPSPQKTPTTPLGNAAIEAVKQGITPVPPEAIDASEFLGTPETPAVDSAPPLTQAAQTSSMNILDGAANGTTIAPVAPRLDTETAGSGNLDPAAGGTNDVLQHDAGTGTGRDGVPGTVVENDGAGAVSPNAGSQPRHVGNASEIYMPDNSALPAQWEVVDADRVTATLKEGQNQPRDRSRAAANVQVQGIANNPVYGLLNRSAVMDNGAPTLSQDGAIVGGNGRFEGVSRAYDQGTATEYRAKLEADAASLGIDPATFAGMKKPVLVRRITQPFDTRALAVASNSGGSLQYSALEQAKIDGERMNGLGDIEVNDTGDVVMSGGNMANVRRALTGYNAAELGSMTDKDGLLSQEGIRRIKNALLYKAYGNSSALSRLVESADSDLKSVMGALVRAAGSVAGVRADMKDGNKPAEADITEDLLSAVEQLSKVKAQGSSVDQHIAQLGVFGKEYSEESIEILRYLNDNIRSQKRMAGFIKQYYDGLASEDHLTGSMFTTTAVTKKERLSHAIETTDRADSATTGQAVRATPRPDSKPVAQDGQQPANTQSDAARNAGIQQDTGVTTANPQSDAGRAQAQSQMDEALAEMGALLRSVANVANIVPEDKPKYMPVLVKMFDAAFKLGYYEIKDASNYVREQLAKLDAKIAKWIPKAWMDEAAKDAAARMPAGFFDNQGVFAQEASQQNSGFNLQGQSNADINAKIAAQAEQERAQQAEDDAAKAEQTKKDQAALDAKKKAHAENPENFVFGESKKDAVKPMGSLWDQPAQPAAESKPPTEPANAPKQPAPAGFSLGDIPKSLKITLEKIIDGKTKRKQFNAQKAMLAANQRVERLEALRKCL